MQSMVEVVCVGNGSNRTYNSVYSDPGVCKMVIVQDDDKFPSPRLCLLRRWPNFEGGFGFSLYEDLISSCALKVQEVVSHSPAEAGGLRKNDVIIEINRENIEQKSFFPLIEILKEAFSQNEMELLVLAESDAQWYRLRNITVNNNFPNIEYCETPYYGHILKPLDSFLPQPKLGNSQIEFHSSTGKLFRTTLVIDKERDSVYKRVEELPSNTPVQSADQTIPPLRPDGTFRHPGADGSVRVYYRRDHSYQLGQSGEDFVADSGLGTIRDRKNNLNATMSPFSTLGKSHGEQAAVDLLHDQWGDLMDKYLDDKFRSSSANKKDKYERPDRDGSVSKKTHYIRLNDPNSTLKSRSKSRCQSPNDASFSFLYSGRDDCQTASATSLKDFHRQKSPYQHLLNRGSPQTQSHNRFTSPNNNVQSPNRQKYPIYSTHKSRPQQQQVKVDSQPLTQQTVTSSSSYQYDSSSYTATSTVLNNNPPRNDNNNNNNQYSYQQNYTSTYTSTSKSRDASPSSVLINDTNRNSSSSSGNLARPAYIQQQYTTSSSNQLGFQLDETEVRTKGVYFVKSVEPNSPSAMAGLKEGDKITKINGKSTIGMDYEQFCEEILIAQQQQMKNNMIHLMVMRKSAKSSAIGSYSSITKSGPTVLPIKNYSKDKSSSFVDEGYGRDSATSSTTTTAAISSSSHKNLISYVRVTSPSSQLNEERPSPRPAQTIEIAPHVAYDTTVRPINVIYDSVVRDAEVVKETVLKPQPSETTPVFSNVLTQKYEKEQIERDQYEREQREKLQQQQQQNDREQREREQREREQNEREQREREQREREQREREQREREQREREQREREQREREQREREQREREQREREQREREQREREQREREQREREQREREQREREQREREQREREQREREQREREQREREQREREQREREQREREQREREQREREQREREQREREQREREQREREQREREQREREQREREQREREQREREQREREQREREQREREQREREQREREQREREQREREQRERKEREEREARERLEFEQKIREEEELERLDRLRREQEMREREEREKKQRDIEREIARQEFEKQMREKREREEREKLQATQSDPQTALSALTTFIVRDNQDKKPIAVQEEIINTQTTNEIYQIKQQTREEIIHHVSTSELNNEVIETEYVGTYVPDDIQYDSSSQISDEDEQRRLFAGNYTNSLVFNVYKDMVTKEQNEYQNSSEISSKIKPLSSDLLHLIDQKDRHDDDNDKPLESDIYFKKKIYVFEKEDTLNESVSIKQPTLAQIIQNLNKGIDLSSSLDSTTESNSSQELSYAPAFSIGIRLKQKQNPLEIGNHVISFVEPNSLADKAGLKINSKLITINDTSCDDKTHEFVAFFLNYLLRKATCNKIVLMVEEPIKLEQIANKEQINYITESYRIENQNLKEIIKDIILANNEQVILGELDNVKNIVHEVKDQSPISISEYHELESMTARPNLEENSSGIENLKSIIRQIKSNTKIEYIDYDNDVNYDDEHVDLLETPIQIDAQTLKHGSNGLDNLKLILQQAIDKNDLYLNNAQYLILREFERQQEVMTLLDQNIKHPKLQERIQTYRVYNRESYFGYGMSFHQEPISPSLPTHKLVYPRIELEPDSPSVDAGLTSDQRVVAVNGKLLNADFYTLDDVAQEIEESYYERQFTDITVLSPELWNTFMENPLYINEIIKVEKVEKSDPKNALAALTSFVIHGNEEKVQQKPVFEVPVITTKEIPVDDFDPKKTRLIHLVRNPTDTQFGFDFKTIKPENRYVASNVQPNLPAHRAGLKDNDYILEVNGESILDIEHDAVVKKIRSKPDQVDLLVITDLDEYLSIVNKAKLQKDRLQSRPVEVSGDEVNLDLRIPSNSVKYYTVTVDPNYKGLGISLAPNGVISSIEPKSPSGKAGLRKDQKIVEVDGIDVRDKSNTEIAKIIKSKESLVIGVIDVDSRDSSPSRVIPTKDDNSGLKSPSQVLLNSVSSATGQKLKDQLKGARVCHLVRRQDFDGYGFSMRASESGPHQISSVETNSPAEQSGLKKEDLILKVNDQNIVGERYSKTTALIKNECEKGILKLEVIDVKSCPSEIRNTPLAPPSGYSTLSSSNKLNKKNKSDSIQNLREITNEMISQS
ncbi:unnamed protein product, partial [Brachionus calyciflorus]